MGAGPVLKSGLEAELKPNLMKFENRIKTSFGKNNLV